MDLGKGKLFQTEIVTGKCPECVCNTILIGFANLFIVVPIVVWT
jgi:hypothetical protein